MRPSTQILFLASSLSWILPTVSTTNQCACGYGADGKAYTDLQETDFTTVTNLLGPASGWSLQEYTLPANISNQQPFARATSRNNVVYNKEGIQLIVRPANNGVVSGAELVSARNDMRYGTFRVGMKTSSVSGTCSAFFWVGL
jgi:hypothetical protein